MRSICLGSSLSTRFPNPYLYDRRFSSRLEFPTSFICVRAIPKTATCNSTFPKGSGETSFKDKEFEAQSMSLPVEEVMTMLKSLSDGEITTSAYDTAWVARIPSKNNAGYPEFPQTLDWIINNQLQDGSWGDKDYFQSYDRILNTLACLVALKVWNVGRNNIGKGVNFLWKSMDKLKKDDGDFLSGFEITFPAMMQEAKAQGLDLPYDLPFVQTIQESRKRKLQRISLQKVHSIPTTILYSLEGLHDHIEWDKILKLQATDGSFLTSPSSTACVYLHTQDHKCLEYLKNIMKRFGDAVPCFYPLDLFERLWVVDTLERLGIDHFFQLEIKNILAYVYKFWTNHGIGWGRECLVKDLDDTAMAFRLLRLHGYNISPDVFQKFISDGKFFCFAGECSHGVSEMLNLYRASQVAFPGEHVLAQAHEYSQEYLSRLDSLLLDKWAVKKDLRGEVLFELTNPWHSCLPRIYTTSYIQKYGKDDLWIAKTLFRLPCVNNKLLLDLAKSDSKRCQHAQQSEIQMLQEWWNKCRFGDLAFTSNKILQVYFTIASCMFEPKLSDLRLYYTKYACLIAVFDDLADHSVSLEEIHSIHAAIKRWDQSAVTELSTDIQICFNGLYNTINDMTDKASKAQRSSSIYTLRHIQNEFSAIISSQAVDAEWIAQKYIPNFKEYMQNANISVGIRGLILSSMFFCGEVVTEEIFQQVADSKFLQLASTIGRFVNDIQTFEVEKEKGELASSISCYMKHHPNITEQAAIQHINGTVEESWKELTREYIQQSKVPQAIKRLIFETTRIMQFLYMKQDNFKRPNERMKAMMNNILFETIP